jgi:ceramide glucosyltransferase
MISLEWAALFFCAAATLLHIGTAVLAWWRVRPRDSAALPDVRDVPVSIVRPVCGIDPCDPLTLRSGFLLDHNNYELIFCCADANDPVAALIRKLIAEHPHVPARLLIGENTSTPNPKLNNLFKGWAAARNEWIVLADSNVLMPPDYLRRMLCGWRADTGVLCGPPIGCMVRGFWSELECAFLNTYQARWQYTADSVGFGFAQGKSMLWRRSVLEKAGGIRALAKEIAEDAAATKVVREQGLRVRLVDRPFGQALGPRTLKQVWQRQLRWARLRRVTFPLMFTPEILTGCVPALVAGAYAAYSFDLPEEGIVLAIAAVWLATEALMARAAGWHTSWTSPLAWLARDAMLPVLWVAAWVGNSFVWRGNAMNVAGESGRRLNQWAAPR